MDDTAFPGWHGTTIIGVKRAGKVVVAGDGQVSLGQTVIKGSARKVRSPRARFPVCPHGAHLFDSLPGAVRGAARRLRCFAADAQHSQAAAAARTAAARLTPR